MDVSDLQARCELGQRQLIATEYLAAEATLAAVGADAHAAAEWDTLARLYMPLQEARRQRRQRCGEGVVHLSLLSHGPGDVPDADRVLQDYPHGQLLVAGWGSIEPARRVRALQRQHALYVETFLAAVYPMGAGRVVVIAPTEDVSLPDVSLATSVDALVRRLPAHCIVLGESELSHAPRAGTPETYAEVMALWERLHAPFLSLADHTPDPRRRIDAYRAAIRVDYACEFAHQRLSATARGLGRAGG